MVAELFKSEMCQLLLGHPVYIMFKHFWLHTRVGFYYKHVTYRVNMLPKSCMMLQMLHEHNTLIIR